jgi:Hypothetical protein (DUF2513)
MRPAPEYIKRLLTAFQDSPEPTTDIQELEQQGLSYQDRAFYFHLRLLNDQGFIEREDGALGIGGESNLAGDYSWSVILLRLTASGHEFAEALGHSKAWAAVRGSLITSSLGIMRDVAVAALKAELSKQGFLRP